MEHFSIKNHESTKTCDPVLSKRLLPILSHFFSDTHNNNTLIFREFQGKHIYSWQCISVKNVEHYSFPF